MEKNYSEKMPIRATLKEMEVGDVVHFPVSKVSVIRSAASTLGLETGRRYMSRINREMMTIDVVRQD